MLNASIQYPVLNKKYVIWWQFAGYEYFISYGGWCWAKLKNTQNLQERTYTGVFFQLATCNFIEKKTPAYLFFLWKCFLRNILGINLLRKNSCELVLKGDFYEKWWSELQKSIVKATALSKNRHFDRKCIFHRYFFSKVVSWKIFLSLTVFRKNIWECFKVQLSVAVSVYFIK